MNREKYWIDKILSEMKKRLVEQRNELMYNLNKCMNEFGAMQMKKIESMPSHMDIRELHNICNSFDSEIIVLYQQMKLLIHEFVEKMDENIFIAVRLQQCKAEKYFSDLTAEKDILNEYNPKWSIFDEDDSFYSLLQSKNLLRESIINELEVIKEKMDYDWRIFEKEFCKCLAEYFIAV